VQHFRILTSDFPDLQAGWNNLAVSLEATDCTVAAQKARACADGTRASTSAASADKSLCEIPACP